MNSQMFSSELRNLAANDPLVAAAWQFAKHENLTEFRFLELCTLLLAKECARLQGAAIDAALGGPIGRYTYEEACEDLKQWTGNT